MRLCEDLQCTMTDLRENCREERSVSVRNVAIYRLREWGHKWDDIADALHRDRSTCIRAHRVSRLIDINLRATNEDKR